MRDEYEGRGLLFVSFSLLLLFSLSVFLLPLNNPVPVSAKDLDLTCSAIIIGLVVCIVMGASMVTMKLWSIEKGVDAERVTFGMIPIYSCFLISAISCIFPILCVFNVLGFGAHILYIYFSAKKLPIRKGLGDLKVIGFGEVVEKLKPIIKEHEAKGTPIVENVNDIMYMFKQLSKSSDEIDLTERTRLSDKVDKLCYVLGSNYYLSIIDEETPWADRAEKKEGVEYAVKDFKEQLRAHLRNRNNRIAGSAELRMKSMLLP